MLTLTLSEIAVSCRGVYVPAQASVPVCGLGTDSRNVIQGGLFVALKGERFDGHDHALAALASGASACVVDAAHPIAKQSDRFIRVADTYQALGQIAAAWRARFTLPVIALTGSNGKTSVKEMLACIARVAFRDAPGAVLATEGNLNNHIGVPLMLARLSAAYKIGIFEAGMNHFGEIAYLTRLIAPQVGLIVNAGPAHLEGVGSIEGVARAKGEMIETLDDESIAVLNHDDVFFETWSQRAGARRIVSFGRNVRATVRGQWDATLADAPLNITIGSRHFTIVLRVAGNHNRMNALAAAAAAHAVGLRFDDISQGLEAYAGVAGRQARRAGINGAVVIDDTYNANPASMLAAVDALSQIAGKKIIVLGQMAELGAESALLHAALGEAIARSPIDRVLATGPLMQAAVNTCGAKKATWYASKEALVAALAPELAPQVTVLVKGSRSSAMEEIVAAIAEKQMPPKDALCS